jgi:hypothetical protein
MIIIIKVIEMPITLSTLALKNQGIFRDRESDSLKHHNPGLD